LGGDVQYRMMYSGVMWLSPGLTSDVIVIVISLALGLIATGPLYMSYYNNPKSSLRCSIPYQSSVIEHSGLSAISFG
jgi:hypothetical protein